MPDAGSSSSAPGSRIQKRAAPLSLRTDVTIPWLAAPDGDVDAMAEVAAGEAAARVLGGRVEGHDVHSAIVSAAVRCKQRLSRARLAA
jgi:hypothetical protein